jgi:hypothetical protein
MSTYNASVAIELVLNEIVQSGIKNGLIPSRFLQSMQLATGTSDGQINVGYYKIETGIGASATTVYDLVGSLTDATGTTLNFDEVVLIAMRNLSGTAANYLTLGPDATAGFGVVASNKGFWVAALGSGGGSVLPADYDSVTGRGSWLILHSLVGIPAATGSTDELSVVTQGGTSANTWEILIFGRDN